MSETTEYLVGGFAHWEDSDGTWWYRDAIGVSCVATLAMLPYLESLAAARREVETVNEEAERQAGVICNLNTDLATSRAAQEGVRRVEAWIQAGNAPDLPEHSIAGLVNARYGAIVRWEDEETTVATGDSLEALGRALAQEAGDGR